MMYNGTRDAETSDSFNLDANDNLLGRGNKAPPTSPQPGWRRAHAHSAPATHSPTAACKQTCPANTPRTRSAGACRSARQTVEACQGHRPAWNWKTGRPCGRCRQFLAPEHDLRVLQEHGLAARASSSRTPTRRPGNRRRRLRLARS